MNRPAIMSFCYVKRRRTVFFFGNWKQTVLYTGQGCKTVHLCQTRVVDNYGHASRSAARNHRSLTIFGAWRCVCDWERVLWNLKIDWVWRSGEQLWWVADRVIKGEMSFGWLEGCFNVLRVEAHFFEEVLKWNNVGLTQYMASFRAMN